MPPRTTYDNLLTNKDLDPKRVDMHDIYMNLVFMLSLKSTCQRAKAGCVIVKEGRIIGTGYNGSPPKTEECISRKECRQKGSKIKLSFNVWTQPKDYVVESEGCFDSIHAETNAFGFCAKNGISTEGSTVYLTFAPCKSCSQLMVAAGVKEIYYGGPFKNDDGLLYAKIYGISLYLLKGE